MPNKQPPIEHKLKREREKYVKALGDKKAMEHRGKRGKWYAPNLKDLYTEKAVQMACQYRKKLQIYPFSQMKDKNNLGILLAKANLIYPLLFFFFLFIFLLSIIIYIYIYIYILKLKCPLLLDPSPTIYWPYLIN